MVSIIFLFSVSVAMGSPFNCKWFLNGGEEFPEDRSLEENILILPSENAKETVVKHGRNGNHEPVIQEFQLDIDLEAIAFGRVLEGVYFGGETYTFRSALVVPDDSPENFFSLPGDSSYWRSGQLRMCKRGTEVCDLEVWIKATKIGDEASSQVQLDISVYQHESLDLGDWWFATIDSPSAYATLELVISEGAINLHEGPLRFLTTIPFGRKTFNYLTLGNIRYGVNYMRDGILVLQPTDGESPVVNGSYERLPDGEIILNFDTGRDSSNVVRGQLFRNLDDMLRGGQ